MTHSTEDELKALGTISSLKRAMAIPHHPTQRDYFSEGGTIHIFTADQGPADLICELLFRYGNGRRERYYDARPETRTIRDSIRVERLEDGGYDTSMAIIHPQHFSRMLEKMIMKHIAPDNISGRGR